MSTCVSACVICCARMCHVVYLKQIQLHCDLLFVWEALCFARFAVSRLQQERRQASSSHRQPNEHNASKVLLRIARNAVNVGS
jgi:hypothetical protein